MAKTPRLSSSDMKVLEFLWIWKVSTTSAIQVHISPQRSIERVYRRLLALENQNFIREQALNFTEARVWLLDARGFQAISGLLPPMRENGYKSEHIGHDLLCHAINLGDWIQEAPSGCSVYSEQQLRRIETDFYPTGAPITPSHRPDGWWRFEHDGNKRLMALEVELSPKDANSYKSLGEFYSETVNIDRAIWLVREENLNYIHQNVKRGNVSDSYGHSFTLVSDFIQLGWQSPIRIGKDAGKTLAKVLNPPGTPSSSHGAGKVILDVRKKPIKPIGNRSPTVSDFL